jgi:hypothetical protein
MIEPLTPRHWGAYFGAAWPSGVCDDGVQVPTPVGEFCAFCSEAIEPEHQGSFIGAYETPPYLQPVHRECSLRSVLGGIGHHRDHAVWCIIEGDPDAGMSYRESSLAVWDWVVEQR